MGLFQKAYETYENLSALVGEKTDGTTEFSEPLAPLGHITTSAGIEITVDGEGCFVSASRVDKNEAKIIIPATEESFSRSSNPCPHPLCDTLKYISPKIKANNDDYIAQLELWYTSEFGHPMLKPILEYVKNGTILADLESSGIDSDDDKVMIRWVVVSPDKNQAGQCWNKKSLFDSFSKYSVYKKMQADTAFCMVTGKETAVANMHMKGVSSINGKAKLISANDTSNFTFRGRFTDSAQASSMGYEASQKAHNALKWIISNQGVLMGGRTFVCWNTKGKTLPRPEYSFLNKSEKVTVEQYKKDLGSTLFSYKNNFSPNDEAIIAFFDAATTGRLALTYYNEMFVTDFLDRLAEWDLNCCFNHSLFGTSAPSLNSIVNCAFGTERGNRIETDERIMKQQLQRLLQCKLSRSEIPYDIVHALYIKTLNPLAYDDKKNRNNLQFTACAVIRKYYIDKYKEEYQMALEKDKRDLSYQYGRLLAILEKAEKDTYDTDQRETNAIRLQSAFCSHPLQTSKTVIEQLKNGYYPKLSPYARGFYDRLMGEIFEIISEYPEASHNAPLKETYILGYYLQRNALYTKNNNNNVNETEETENE